MQDILRSECKCQRMRRFKPVLLHRSKMQSRPQHLKSLRGRHIFRCKIQLLTKSDQLPFLLIAKRLFCKIQIFFRIAFRNAFFQSLGTITFIILRYTARLRKNRKIMPLSIHMMREKAYRTFQSRLRIRCPRRHAGRHLRIMHDICNLKFRMLC